MARSVSPLYFAVAGVGVGLLFSAVRNESPVALLRSVLTGGDVERAPIYTRREIEATAEATATGVGPLAPAGTTPALVTIGQGGHKLTADAAEAFARWQRLYGSTIWITDSYRSYADQLAAHQREPDRFADPRSSAAMHTRGLAVDVDLGRTTAGQSKLGQPKYDRLYQTATLANFHNYRRGLTGHTWHFSFGVAA